MQKREGEREEREREREGRERAEIKLRDFIVDVPF